jgi:hypothetical protein
MYEPVRNRDLPRRSRYQYRLIGRVNGHLTELPRPTKQDRHFLDLVRVLALRELEYVAGLPKSSRSCQGDPQESHVAPPATYDGRGW